MRIFVATILIVATFRCAPPPKPESSLSDSSTGQAPTATPNGNATAPTSLVYGAAAGPQWFRDNVNTCLQANKAPDRAIYKCAQENNVPPVDTSIRTQDQFIAMKRSSEILQVTGPGYLFDFAVVCKGNTHKFCLDQKGQPYSNHQVLFFAKEQNGSILTTTVAVIN